MVLMKKRSEFISWRLKLILFLGVLGGLSVTLFGMHVESISDLPLGPTPLSWTFKSSSARVTEMFSKGNSSEKVRTLKSPEIPSIDKVIPDSTELALFALG